jgi:membrane associated rhomboid family serine protease
MRRMGIYDRDYNRGNYPQSGFNLGGATTVTTRIVIFMFAVYAVQLFDTTGWFERNFKCYADVLKHPLEWYQLLTAGFLHDPQDLKHIIFNMLGLWFFGRDVEYRYGRREYLLFFLVSIVVGNLVWVLGELVVNRGFASGPAVLGASGGVTAVLILFALNFPHRTMLFMFVIPMPMWVGAILIVILDAYGAIGRSDNVAFTAHLGGALFALLYYQGRWHLERLLPSGNLLKRLKPKPNLRVHDPDSPDDSTDDQVDEILKKIQEQGRASLTRQERRILEEASQKYQKRRK